MEGAQSRGRLADRWEYMEGGREGELAPGCLAVCLSVVAHFQYVFSRSFERGTARRHIQTEPRPEP